MTGRPLRALLYGDVNLNIIDGSAIWAQSMAECLARASCEVTLLLKARVRTGRLVDPISQLDNVRLVRPFEDGLVRSLTSDTIAPGEARKLLRELDEQAPYDLVVMRGIRAVDDMAKEGVFDGRLWTYLTDIPQSVPRLDDVAVERLRRIARSSRFMLCQTEELRCFLESAIPEACGRSVLWSPVVPPPEFPLPQRRSLTDRPFQIVYTGKFARLWNTLEMTELPARLAERGVEAELHMVGDKIHDDPTDPGFSARMRAALEHSPRVVWHGGVPRQEAMELSAAADVGLSWRDPALDASLELSTKVLEFGSLGLPVVINRTPMHERFYGRSYPLFVQNQADVVDVLAALPGSPEVYAHAARRCTEVSAGFRLDGALDRMRALLRRAFPSASAGSLPSDLLPAGRRLRVLVAGHDLKFFTAMVDHLRALPQLEVRIDAWEALARHDEPASAELAAWADVVVAEWCGPVAIWYSKHKRPGSRLIVRLHRFELFSPYPAKVDISAVDQVVCVSPHYARLTREATGWPAEKIVVIPNWVDVDQMDRPKLEGSQLHLGMIGIAPMRKRMDLALDVLERLRGRDDRYLLLAKTKMPWEYWWIWKGSDEQRHFSEIFRRIQISPRLRGAVVFDDFGGDVAAWLRRVGFVLSTSDDESFHLAPAEGMASGAVPMLLGWPGADTIYDDRWIHGSTHEMADAIHELVASGRWEAERQFARARVRETFPLSRVCDAVARLLVEDLPPDTAERPLMSSTRLTAAGSSGTAPTVGSGW